MARTTFVLAALPMGMLVSSPTQTERDFEGEEERRHADVSEAILSLPALGTSSVKKVNDAILRAQSPRCNRCPRRPSSTEAVYTE